MDTTTVVEPTKPTELQVLKRQSSDLVARAQAFIVNSAESDAECAAIGQQCAMMEKGFLTLLKPNVDRLHQAHKAAVGERDALVKPLKDAKQILGRKSGEWRAAEEAKRREREAALRTAAEKRAVEERLREAEAMADAGHEEAADELLDAPIVATPVVLPKTTPQIRDTATTTRWTAKIVNESLIPRPFWMLDLPKIRAHVRTHKENHGIPGVEAVPETSTTFRT